MRRRWPGVAVAAQPEAVEQQVRPRDASARVRSAANQSRRQQADRDGVVVERRGASRSPRRPTGGDLGAVSRASPGGLSHAGRAPASWTGARAAPAADQEGRLRPVRRGGGS
jgi:hypothetical protein